MDDLSRILALAGMQPKDTGKPEAVVLKLRTPSQQGSCQMSSLLRDVDEAWDDKPKNKDDATDQHYARMKAIATGNPYSRHAPKPGKKPKYLSAYDDYNRIEEDDVEWEIESYEPEDEIAVDVDDTGSDDDQKPEINVVTIGKKPSRPIQFGEAEEDDSELEVDDPDAMVDLGDEEDSDVTGSEDLSQGKYKVAEPTGYKDTSIDPYDLIQKIAQLQDSGMSSANAYYDIDKLEDMPLNSLKRIYSKVVGESISEDEEVFEYGDEQYSDRDEDEDEGQDNPEAMVDLGDEEDSDVTGSEDLSQGKYKMTEPTGYRDASFDPYDLIQKIAQLQDSGMSSANAYYDIEKLEDLPTNRLMNIYRKVVGEKIEEEDNAWGTNQGAKAGNESNGYGSTTVFNAKQLFPTGNASPSVKKVGNTGAQFKDNPMSTESVYESIETIHKKLKARFENFMKK